MFKALPYAHSAWLAVGDRVITWAPCTDTLRENGCERFATYLDGQNNKWSRSLISMCGPTPTQRQAVALLQIVSRTRMITSHHVKLRSRITAAAEVSERRRDYV